MTLGDTHWCRDHKAVHNVLKTERKEGNQQLNADIWVLVGFGSTS